MRIRLDITYDGTDFCGWQIQAQGKSVQGEVTAAVKKLTGEDVSLIGSGRTDAGVHAVCQVAHFDLNRDFDVKKIKSGLNFYLPPAIKVIKAEQAADDFNARFSAVSKTYFYLLYVADTDNPLLRFRALRVGSLDVDLMNKAASFFVGRQDFSAFMSSGSEVKSTVRCVTDCKAFAWGEFIRIEVSADGFLYNMVRKIAACLVQVGEGKLALEEVQAILKSPQFKPIAPPHALYLQKVEY